MQLNWSTFLLEIANFLILLWILKRLFYGPLQRAMERRRAAALAVEQETERLRAEALAGEERLQQRLRDWEGEKEQRRQQFLRELEEERGRRSQQLQQTLDREREVRDALEAQHREEQQRRLEEQAIAQAGQFAARLLEALASPELEARLIELFLADMERLRAAGQLPAVPSNGVQALESEGGEAAAVEVSTVFALDEAQRQAVAKAVSAWLGAAVELRFRRQPELLAGIAVAAGGLVLGANLKDELKFFREADGHEA